MSIETKSHNSTRNPVALDPGIRTFISYYSPLKCGEIGKSDMGKIIRLGHHLDDLCSKMTKVKAKKRQRMKKAATRIRKRIQNLVSELHWKTATFLCKNFSTILIPEFKMKSMISKLIAKTSRSLMTWSHFTFRQRLIHLATKYDTRVIICREDFTSKTCTRCGNINNNLGSKKVFICPSCNLRIDRDINGARNILLRALGDTPV